MTRAYGDWAEAKRRLSTAPRRLPEAVRKAILLEAHRIRGEMVNGIRSGAPAGKQFAPHARLTELLRAASGFKGTKILIRGGGLIGSIGVIETSRGAFVGVRRSAKAKGKALAAVNLSELHEGGKTITQQWTARQQRWFFAQLRELGAYQEGTAAKGGGNVHKIRIPARPHVQPILDKYAKPEDVKRNVARHTARLLGGDFGYP